MIDKPDDLCTQYWNVKMLNKHKKRLSAIKGMISTKNPDFKKSVHNRASPFNPKK